MALKTSSSACATLALCQCLCFLERGVLEMARETPGIQTFPIRVKMGASGFYLYTAFSRPFFPQDVCSFCRTSLLSTGLVKYFSREEAFSGSSVFWLQCGTTRPSQGAAARQPRVSLAIPSIPASGSQSQVMTGITEDLFQNSDCHPGLTKPGSQNPGTWTYEELPLVVPTVGQV